MFLFGLGWALMSPSLSQEVSSHIYKANQNNKTEYVIHTYDAQSSQRMS